ncbi:5-carboxymethyl-2-hydroxymuconate Delta-isomerase [Streptomyces sp. NBC_01264]|uniref:5-carboxymethyl-2-hydroxymuconate Delta-isomerase n=1 Tax=Streptomyces sp. NBC_01264 TaxID=2903804 RepID=UPI00224F4769|nr:isomerase [Streptomyces sp. NBC_01264]MCX4782365.1 isomerase [Streptomyces sp. NBC_01264]
MPQITVDYSANLSDTFDRHGFASALHALTAEVAAATVANCKTRFRCPDDVYVADGAPGSALVHVQIGLLPGRTEAVKAELSQAVLDLLFKHLPAGADGAGPVVHASVDVSELGAAYRKLVQ